MAEDLINLTPGTTPPNPNIHAIIGSGDPTSATGDTDLTGAPIGSLFIRRDGIPGTFLYKKTASPNTWQVNDRVFDVRVYGAVGDGVTDDSGAFTKALTAAGAVSGTVYVPPPPGKSYLIATQLTFPQNTTMQLAGGVTVLCNPPTGSIAIQLEDGCVIRGQSAAGSVIQCGAGNFGISIGNQTSGNSCVFMDITVSGITTTGGLTPGAGIVSNAGAAEVIIQRCVVNGFQGNAIDSQTGSANWRITETIIHGTGSTGIAVGRNSTGFIITNNHISSVGLAGITLNSRSNVVSNNWIENSSTNGSYGISLAGLAAGENILVSECQYCVVSGNRIIGFKDCGLGIFPGVSAYTSDNLITGNVVTGSGGYGLMLHAGGQSGAYMDRNAIIGNIFTGNNLTGILVYGYNAASISLMLIANNSITYNGGGQSGQNGIQMQGLSTLADTQILHNVVVNNADGTEPNQINLIATTRTTVAGNKTETTDGIYKIVNTNVLVDNTGGGASLVNLAGSSASEFQVNGTPVT